MNFESIFCSEPSLLLLLLLAGHHTPLHMVTPEKWQAYLKEVYLRQICHRYSACGKQETEELLGAPVLGSQPETQSTGETRNVVRLWKAVSENKSRGIWDTTNVNSCLGNIRTTRPIVSLTVHHVPHSDEQIYFPVAYSNTDLNKYRICHSFCYLQLALN